MAGDYFAGGTCARERNGRAELLVLRYREEWPQGQFREKIKFPGGDQNPGEFPEATFRREMGEEIAGKEFNLKDVSLLLEVAGINHTKNFFTFHYEGELRQEEMVDGSGTILFPPEYCSAETLFGYDSRTFVAGHRSALVLAIEKYAEEYQSFYELALKLGLRVPGHKQALVR